MITVVITIFIISIIAAFGVLCYSAWEVRTEVRTENGTPVPAISFRKVERQMLYIAKHLIQSLVLISVKYWFLGVAKTKKWMAERWPRVRKFLENRHSTSTKTKHSFVHRAVLESKTKIKHIKERIKKEHEIK